MKILVKEVEGLKQMVKDMMEKVTGLRLEDKGEETENRVTKTGANQEREEAAGNVRTEERNPESPIGKEIDLHQWDTLVFKGEHAENEHWRLVEDTHG